MVGMLVVQMTFNICSQCAFVLTYRFRFLGVHRYMVLYRILGSHYSHGAIESTESCADNLILPLWLPSCSTHLLQPLLDVGLSGQFQNYTAIAGAFMAFTKATTYTR